MLPRRFFFILISSFGFSLLASAEKPNVLFIAIDDLRNDVGALGVAHAKTPQLDRLAKTSRIFSHHYVQVPTCGASRAALLRGRYPDSKPMLGNAAIRETSTQWADVSMPGWFRQHGYLTYALGKVTHHPGGLWGENWDDLPEEMPGVWDRIWIPETPWQHSQGMMHAYANGKPRTRGETPVVEAFDGPDKAYPDAWVAEAAVAHMRELKHQKAPWFFAVGFFKPHLPLSAPKRWHDIHADTEFPVPPIRPDARQSPGWHESREMRVSYNQHGREVYEDAAYAQEIRQAYAATVSYMDHQVGLVLDALEEAGLADNTIIAVWSDHGFQLGEHDMWAKHTLFEQALRSPLMIRYPGMPLGGATTAAITETVDVMPTLLELCGLPLPDSPLDGASLKPQLLDPKRPTDQIARGFWREHRTVRDTQWRLIVYPEDGDETTELFDLQNDPYELENIAGQHPEVVARLKAELTGF